MPPLVLLSNDDGVDAPGLRALAQSIRARGAEVVVVAPERNQSGGSHAITLDRPLRHRRLDAATHAVDGTPADCIYIALHPGLVLPRLPDLVVSGLNHGPNLGSDVFYSGTVAAAREGALRGLPAMAFSLDLGADSQPSACSAAAMALRLLAAERPAKGAPLLNVNFPAGEPKGAVVTRLGRREYAREVTVRNDPRGREYYWLGGGEVQHVLVEGSDTQAVDDGYISVTPLAIEVTAAEHWGLAAWTCGGFSTGTPVGPAVDSRGASR